MKAACLRSFLYTCAALQTTLQLNPIYVFLFWELRDLKVPISTFNVSVSDLYISRIGPHIWLQHIDRSILEIYKSLTDI